VTLNQQHDFFAFFLGTGGSSFDSVVFTRDDSAHQIGPGGSAIFSPEATQATAQFSMKCSSAVC